MYVIDFVVKYEFFGKNFIRIKNVCVCVIYFLIILSQTLKDYFEYLKSSKYLELCFSNLVKP